MPIQPRDPEEFDRALSPPLLAAVEAGILPGRRGRIVQILSGFLLGQGAAQGINVLAGLFLVRRLSIESYAQYGLATGFQTVFSVLMDLGFASTIVPLVADRREDRALVGRYVRSARHLRDRAFLYLAPIASLVFLASMRQHHWSIGVQVALLASVLLSLYSGGKVSYFSAPLFVYGRLREYYLPQVVSGGGRLLTYIALGFTGGLNAWTAAGLGALGTTINARLIARGSLKQIEWPREENEAVNQEMIRYILPATPAIIFSAFQSQISLFLISFFGGTQNLAEVTALSRIGQLFAVAMTFNVIVVEPYIARQPRAGLARKFIAILLLTIAASLPLILVAFRWPQAFLWIIGARYDSVRPLMGWFILSSCLYFLTGLLWVMNRARKWVFWSGSILEIALLLIVQVAFCVVLGVHTTRNAVFFGLVSSACVGVAHLYVTLYGFLKGAPRSAPSPAVPAAG